MAGTPPTFRMVHVTGTNGKSSTARMIAALLQQNGLHVGTYTSPHLHTVNERMTCDGEVITDVELAELLGQVAVAESAIGERASFFESLTTAAVRWFADRRVDVAVMEVAVLGRRDATNALDGDVAVITNIGNDHNDVAGPTKVDVAREKAGIVKPGSVVVIGESDPDLREVLMRPEAAGWRVVGTDFAVLDRRAVPRGQVFDVRTQSRVVREVFLPVRGAFQATNAAIALVAAEALVGAPLSESSIRDGFAGIVTPGRFEWFERPLTVVDGAHNEPAAEACAHEFFEAAAIATAARVLVVGTSRDPAKILTALRAHEFDAVIACAAREPRAVPAEVVQHAASRAGCRTTLCSGSVAEAVASARHLAHDDGAVLVAGSLYVAAEARRALSGYTEADHRSLPNAVGSSPEVVARRR